MRQRGTTAEGLSTGSLATRVTVLVLTMLTVVLLGLGVFVHVALGTRLRTDLRNLLVDRAELARSLDGQLTGQSLADRISGAGVAATVGTGAAQAVGRSPVGPFERPPGDGPGAGRRGRRGGQVGPANAGADAAAGVVGPVQRIGPVLSVTDQLPRAGAVTLSVSDADARAALRRLTVLEALGSLGLLVVAALACSRLVGVALRPLDRMTALARASASGVRGGRLRPTRADTELGRTATAFDAMLDGLESSAAQARAAEEHLRRFLADASHELRTPITALQLSAETLLREELDPAARESHALAAVRAARRAGRLVDDLLVMARAEQGAELDLRFAPVDLVGLAEEGVQRARLLAPQLLVSVEPGSSPSLVLGDATRLGQIVDNLLDNALRLTPAGGRVTASVLCARGRARLTVTDTGPGVDEADQDRIFERFVRLAPEAYPGSGLGLPLARLLARAHGGEVSCLTVGSGAAFRLELPALAALPAALNVGGLAQV